MPTEDDDTARLAQMAAELKRRIDKRGYTMMGAFPEGPGEGPGFVYSIGLTAFGLPELCIAGLDAESSASILSEVADRVYDGLRLSHGQVLPDVLADGYDVIVVEGFPSRTGITAGMAVALYGAAQVRLQQLVWPDEDHRFPWDEGYALLQRQPLVGSYLKAPASARPDHAGRGYDEGLLDGLAKAAHYIEHSVGQAHGAEDMTNIAGIESRPCCQSAVLNFSQGVTEGLYEQAGMDAAARVRDHAH